MRYEYDHVIMRDMRDALIWDGVGRALSRGSWDYWRTGTVGDTGTGHRRGAKRGHRVLQGCWKRSIGPDVELSMQLVVKNWKLGWELGNGECWSSQGEKQIQG